MMMNNNNAAFYPANYGTRPFVTLPMNFSIRRPSIPLYYAQVVPQVQHAKAEPRSDTPTTSIRLYDLDTNNESEIIRLIFSYIGISYKDKRLKQDEWIKIKDDMSFDQLPILTINNKFKIFQLHAIIRHLAREYHLYGRGKHDQAIVDIVVETTRQFQEKISNSTSINEEIIQIEYLKQLEKFYDIFKRQGPFYLGAHISLADLIVYDTINNFIKNDSKLLDNYSHLKEARKILEKHPKILNYMNKRPPAIKEIKIANPNPQQQQQEQKDDENKSKHHYCRHHRHRSKEPTPISQRQKKGSIRSSKSPSGLTIDQAITPRRPAINIPPPPPIINTSTTEQKTEIIIQ